MEILALGLAFGLLYALRLPGLLRLGSTRDLVVFTALVGLACTLTILTSLGVRLPYMTVEIARLMETYVLRPLGLQ